MPAKFERSLIPSAPDSNFEEALWGAGIQYVAGIDEAGRGALAGPVSAGAIIFPASRQMASLLDGVHDSKQMTPEKRRQWAARLPGLAVTWAVGFASAGEIDEIGIVPATRLAVQRALDLLRPAPQHLLVDFMQLPECPLPQMALVKGDARCLSIAAASILAKVARDDILRQYELEYPGYGFAAHKGYGTQAHIQAIQRLGYSAEHRRSFHINKAYDLGGNG